MGELLILAAVSAGWCLFGYHVGYKRGLNDNGKLTDEVVK